MGSARRFFFRYFDVVSSPRRLRELALKHRRIPLRISLFFAVVDDVEEKGKDLNVSSSRGEKDHAF